MEKDFFDVFPHLKVKKELNQKIDKILVLVIKQQCLNKLIVENSLRGGPTIIETFGVSKTY